MYQVMVSGLALLDGRVNVEREVHLPLVLVRQQKQPEIRENA
jgi:hypothetical protein